MEEVECAECGNRYDSDQHPFCPRCGSVGSAPTTGLAPQRFEPARRRAQAGGVILAVLGAVAMLFMGYMAIAPPDVDDEQLRLLRDVDSLATQPGGQLRLRVLSNGTAADVHVMVRPSQGDAVAVPMDGAWANTTAPTAFGNLSFEGAGHNLSIGYYAPAGTTVTADVDLQRPPEWVATRDVGAVRVLAAFFAFFGAFVVLGGMLAARLRAWRLGLAAAIVAMVPGLLMLFLIPAAGLLFVLPPAVALAFIVAGRRHFA